VQSAGKWDFPGIILLKKNLWTKSTDRWTAPARSTMDRRPLPCAGAHRSSASGCSSLPALGDDSRVGGVGHGGLGPGLTGAQEVVEWRRDGGEGGGGDGLSTGSLRAWREGKEGRGRIGDERGCRGSIL
jgi:hypothetical protein